MKAALAMFKEFPCKRRFALLGDMLELGDLSRSAHEELGCLAAESNLYALVTYGENAKRTAVVAAKGVKTMHADNYREAADALLNRMEPGDALLVKASRGMALEKVLEIFYKEQKDERITLWQKWRLKNDSFRLDRCVGAGVCADGGARQSDGFLMPGAGTRPGRAGKAAECPHHGRTVPDGRHAGGCGRSWVAACIAQPQLLGGQDRMMSRLLIGLFGSLAFGGIGLADDLPGCAAAPRWGCGVPRALHWKLPQQRQCWGFWR